MPALCEVTQPWALAPPGNGDPTRIGSASAGALAGWILEGARECPELSQQRVLGCGDAPSGTRSTSNSPEARVQAQGLSSLSATRQDWPGGAFAQAPLARTHRRTRSQALDGAPRPPTPFQRSRPSTGARFRGPTGRAPPSSEDSVLLLIVRTLFCVHSTGLWHSSCPKH